MRIKDVIFDLYGTLVDIRTDERRLSFWRKAAEIFSKNGADYLPADLKKRYFSTVKNEEQAALKAAGGFPEIDILRVFAELYRAKGVEADPALLDATAKAFREASTERLRLYPEAAALLKRLRESGMRIWLLSNAQAAFTRPELQALGLEGSFDGVYLSSELGFKKPDPRFFEALLTEQKISAETAVMIGNDGGCDIAPARSLGLKTVYVRSEISPKESPPQSDFFAESSGLMKIAGFILQGE